jgi:hypothetical protein
MLTSHPHTRIAVIAQRVEAEFRELPGLRLTRWQAARLWTLSPGECDAVLSALVKARVLRETPDGFVRN